MRLLLVVATALQIVAVGYGVLLLAKHRTAPVAWLALLGTLSSMLVWRIVMSTGITPGVAFNTLIAMWGSVCAVAAMYFFSKDMARRERAEAERDRLFTLERAARTDAERASRVKDEFMATLSHELRSPLAAILGWCAIFRRARNEADARRAVDTIERNARLQTRLVDDLLDATRMQAGTLHLDLQPVLLSQPVTAALEIIRPTATAKRLHVAFRSDDEVVVLGDAARLQQVAANLLVNAVKFTPEGGRIEVDVRRVDGRAEFTVVDSGIGIPSAFMPALFEKFSQADTGSARRHGGLGLGLAIVDRLVGLHGGEVRAESDGPGQGATFVVRLPLAPAGAPTASPVDVPDTTSASVAGLRVLIVDDEADVRGAVAGLLEQEGAAVLALASGATVVDAIATFQPDVLVLDIGLPGEDGYALIERIRATSPVGIPPAISLTAHARQDDRDRALRSGFQAHLPKPLDFPLLARTIHAVVRGAAPARPPQAQKPLDPA